MDILADILKQAGLRSRVLNQRALYSPWALRFPCPRSMGFHVVTQGQAWLWQSESSPPLHLHRGDIAFMSRGTSHWVSSSPDPDLLKSAEDCSASAPPHEKAGQEPLVTVVSGAYQLWHAPIHPLFQDLPEWVIIHADRLSGVDTIQTSLTLLAQELENSEMGSEAIVRSILEILFHLILRRILKTSESRRWTLATQDPAIGQALQLMHAHPDKDWSLESLAETVGLSRTGFANKFRKILGDTPLHYLTELRMQKAMAALADSTLSLEKIAHTVGYQDAFGFSKSFKKMVGLSPREFRRKNEAEKALSWRFE
ncbi:hypothetical protein COW36_15950 [bacterium (Candidatus Blackallbacteria) CG17_big_fil_post_rev_8_21_14_2_50_48_46]|uniref:HTH araC/xylS-type domain-containing protein n=1 Tax=bacterium (Candidatus Blackallbacteria) CG17_big_fil_post_rev_8_21_14_2_50_48_46 TaxID=2014261 RepID=A0A2M7G1X8_9BACT|nr:MAG: hypothetical protein COW64_09100 [bacterium (Candidatus Blackallbacteria) CG18_big_fil_WC_8_21_14_2_50_49_26]PIW15761.1 MAG: hypothetical protein COW36_15950 [bacterium (Candidatus Blackallbacteria) CG17_big_fil_post_rev_8_21_14_2_50_48_46]PIW48741.1 MAG: hypothetical protein COW20_08305 [bacterium (Candidatus Blackallbacteria) CG13_big_fil_rev_8_21_14_2_50_49_14]